MWDGAGVRQIAHENEWLQRRWLDLVARERSAGRMQTRRPDLDQLLTSLFHALSSDWAFLVTRGQSVDYARRRAELHRREFHQLAQLVEDGRRDDARAEAARLAARDDAFPALDARLAAARRSRRVVAERPDRHERTFTTLPGMPATTDRGG